MSKFEGKAAVRLFIGRATAANCNNIELLERLEEETKRECPPNSTNTNTENWLPELLPTMKKIQRALQPDDDVRSLLCCRCQLCGNKDEESRRQFYETIRKGDIFGNGNIKGLAGLTFCGCLFALKAFCDPRSGRLLSTLVREALLEKPLPPSLHRQLRSSQPEICHHCGPQNINASVYNPSENGFSQCGNCLEHAFRNAVGLWGKIVNIPVLETSTECMDRTTENVPMILQKLISPTERGETLNLWFYTSKIEPDCAEIPGHKNEDLVFRKVYNYRPEENNYIQRAIKEADIAIALARRDHGSIAHVLLAFQWRDSSRHYIELVFPNHLSDLGKLFSGSYTPPEPQSTQHHAGFDHPLWKAAIDVVDALAVMHDAINKEEIPCKGHFDIKPANILIKKYGQNEVIFLLTDFGQAAAHQPGTQDHKPPEISGQSNGNAEVLTQAYDIWSMACVLLQVCIYITKGQGEIQSFNAERFRPDSTNPEFWQREANGTSVLRPSVTAELKAIETGEVKDPRTQTIVETLRLMFSIDPRQRPTAAGCLSCLRCPRDQNTVQSGLTAWDQRLDQSGHTPWEISYTADEGLPPIRTRLWLYRHQRNRIGRANSAEKFTLKNQLVKCETKAIKDVSFVPLAFSDSSSSSHTTYACCFRNIHDGITFHFTRLSEFLEFMTLMTYQRVVPVEPDNPTSGMEIRVSSSSIQKKGRFILSDTSKFKRGRLQVWKQATQAEYNKSYPVWPDVPSDQSNKHVRQKQNLWKIALWTTNMSNQEVCVVIDIGSKAWKVKIPQNSTALCLTQLPSRAFRGAVLESLDQNEKVPGFPISPDLLSTKLCLQLEKVEIKFAELRDREKFVKILKDNDFPTNN
ncbi:kinase-like domain-containing protein [Ilyonectria destructans]|nr:kinase-like domain-containing protein [Ilyonectria destructans]